MELDGGLAEQLLSSSDSDFLLLPKLEESVAVCFWLTAGDLVVQSLLPLLTGGTTSLEESSFRSDGFLFSEETLDGVLLSSKFWSSLRPSRFSLWRKNRMKRISAKTHFQSSCSCD